MPTSMVEHFWLALPLQSHMVTEAGGFVGKLPGQINVFIVEQASDSTPLRYVLLLLFTAIT